VLYQLSCCGISLKRRCEGSRARDVVRVGQRDESVIDRPDAFIVDREKPRQHLSYGAGIHRCTGDRLADLQLRVLWEEILARDLEIEVMGPPKRLYSNFIRGITQLPVRIKR